ncbi:hypothetical protein AB1L07_22895 [Niallia alba]|uniref:hypothetical protein n=1 Tax=Niallia alba TaxID=2729105 RepID=UPI00399EF399
MIKQKGFFMFGLLLAIFVFNIACFKVNKLLNKNQIAHIWMFTVAFQTMSELYINLKYRAYWYFTPNVDVYAFLPLALLVPPVNILFLNWYPYNNSIKEKVLYFLYWEIFIVAYEVITLLPEPWGYFNYGWWNLELSILVDPILLFILLKYYKAFVRTAE